MFMLVKVIVSEIGDIDLVGAMVTMIDNIIV